MRLPEKYVREGLELAGRCTLFGIPLEELSREELLAAAARGCQAELKAREAASAALKFISEFRS